MRNENGIGARLSPAARAFSSLQADDVLLPAEPSGAKRAGAIILTAMVLISAPLFWAANAAGLIGDLPAAIAKSGGGHGGDDDDHEGHGGGGDDDDDDSAGGTLKTDDTSANGHSTRGRRTTTTPTRNWGPTTQVAMATRRAGRRTTTTPTRSWGPTTQVATGPTRPGRPTTTTPEPAPDPGSARREGPVPAAPPAAPPDATIASQPRYQGIGSRSRKKPPLGPSSGRVASQTAVSAPSSTERGALSPPIRVLTQPGQRELTRIPEPASSAASTRVRALSAVFETR